MAGTTDSRQIKAMETAFMALKLSNFPSSTEEGEIDAALDKISSENSRKPNTRTLKLLHGILTHKNEISSAIGGISPDWLIASLPQDDLILLYIFWYRFIFLKEDPQRVIHQIFNFAKQLARRLAFQVLYALAFQQPSTVENLTEAYILATAELSNYSQKPEGYAWRLVSGVWMNRHALDDAIKMLSNNRKTARMGRIERTLLELALYEMTCVRLEFKDVLANCEKLAQQFGVGKGIRLIEEVLRSALAADAPLKFDCASILPKK